MGVAGLFFVEPGAEVGGKYSQDVLHRNKCYPLSDMLRVTISSFSRTAHLHIGRVIQSNSCSVNSWFHFSRATCMAPKSPDLNPVDYKIWGIMQQPVYEMQIHNVDELKRQLVDVWSERSAAKCWRCCQPVEKASAGVCSHEGRTFQIPAVGCFDSRMKLSIDSPCTTCFWSFQ